jgi:hypothetical protein
MNIEAGYYYFRATGMDDKGEMLVITSYSELCIDSKALAAHKADFIKLCINDRKVKNPKITHTIREPREYVPFTDDYDCGC